MIEIDVICGACDGRFSVDPSIDQARCPHCEASLDVPENCEAGAILPVSAVHSARNGSSIHGAGDSGIGDIAVPSSIKAPDFRQWGGAEDDPAAPVAESPVPESSVALASPIESSAPVDAGPTQSGRSAGPREPSHPGAVGEGGVSRGVFLAIIVYASIMTALCLGLAYLLLTSRQRQLESLPDVVPPRNADGEIARTLVPVEADMPPGHRLALGTSRRFGDLLVTPLRITREPLEFTHYRGEGTRAPAGEVLKLWLEFKNVGESGTAFTPLDGALLFYRLPGPGPLKANNFLARETGEGAADRIAIYDHPPASDWDLAGQELGTVLAAGERWKTFVPTETDLPALDGSWVWRLHLRKGIASNGWGVTTLVEIEFDADDVKTSPRGPRVGERRS